jgi:hypothetical protein
MASLDSLPGDQRAVLQLVLGRGRSYDEIARLLSINPSGVRERAVAALDALGPQTRLEEASRAQIADYLLGQLPEDQLDEVRDRLAQSAPDRAWARVLSSELAPLASGPLPEIPLETSAARAAASPPAPPEPVAAPEPPPGEPPPAEPGRADPVPAGEGPAPVPAPPAGDGDGSEARTGRERGRRARRRRKRAPEPEAAPVAAATPEGDGAAPRSSRIGGLIVIAVAVLVVAVVVVVVATSGGSGSKHASSSTTTTAAAAPPTTATTTATGTASTPTSTGTTTAAKVIAQINLTSPTSGSKAVGLAQVLKQGSADGIALVAQHMTPNTTEPANAYAVWLYNSSTDAHILGFVNPGVGSSGQLSTAGPLPANATHYKQLIVTLETTGSPKQPGTIVLEGPFSEG